MGERTSVVEIGDELTVPDYPYVRWTVTHIEQGQYGLLLLGEQDGHQRGTYLPYELERIEHTWDWFGWCDRGIVAINSARQVGYVAMAADNPGRNDIAVYDAEWERTTEAMKAEEGVMQSRPTDIRLN